LAGATFGVFLGDELLGELAVSALFDAEPCLARAVVAFDALVELFYLFACEEESGMVGGRRERAGD
jgi:hypothetical protein